MKTFLLIFVTVVFAFLIILFFINSLLYEEPDNSWVGKQIKKLKKHHSKIKNLIVTTFVIDLVFCILYAIY